jgi:hypothetical protein
MEEKNMRIVLVAAVAAFAGGASAMASAADATAEMAASMGWQWVKDSKIVQVNAHDAVSLVVACPSGKNPVSGGFAQSSSPEKFTLVQSSPVGNTWRIEMRNITNAGQPVELYAYVLCAKGVPLAVTPAAPAAIKVQ